MKHWRLSGALALLICTPALAQPATAAAAASASAAPVPTQRLRGTVQSFDGSTLVITERRGELLRLALADNFSVSEVLPIALDAIQPGSFVGPPPCQGPTVRCGRWKCWCSPKPHAARARATFPGTCSPAAR